MSENQIQDFKFAKQKLKFMQRLRDFHDNVLALPLPHFFNKHSIQLYQQRYVDLLYKYFLGDQDKYYKNLKFFDLYDESLYDDPEPSNAEEIRSPFNFSFLGLKWGTLGRRKTLRQKDIEHEATNDQEAEKMQNQLKDQLEFVLEPIEHILSRRPKPSTNVLQRIFKRDRFFKFKESVLGEETLKYYRHNPLSH